MVLEVIAVLIGHTGGIALGGDEGRGEEGGLGRGGHQRVQHATGKELVGEGERKRGRRRGVDGRHGMVHRGGVEGGHTGCSALERKEKYSESVSKPPSLQRTLTDVIIRGPEPSTTWYEFDWI